MIRRAIEKGLKNVFDGKVESIIGVLLIVISVLVYQFATFEKSIELAGTIFALGLAMFPSKLTNKNKDNGTN